MDMFRVFLLCLMITSCGVHVSNWQGSSSPGLDTAHYDNFDQTLTHPVKLGKGDILFVDYAVDAKKGSVDIAVKQGNTPVWQQPTGNDSGAVQVIAPNAGKYTINITGHHATGGYKLRYAVAKPKWVSVKNSVNIELFGLLLQLDNGADLIASKDTVMIDGRRATWAQWYALAVENYRIYKDYDTCKVMQLFRKLQSEGIYNDFFVDFLIQVDEAPNARINPLTDAVTIQGFSPKGDTAGARQRANEFLAALNDFYQTISFEQYLEKHKQHYAQATAQVKRNLPGGELLPVMEHYYRQQFKEYYLVPGLNILTSMGFGKVNRNSGTIYNIFGPFGFQDFTPQHPDMGFDYPERIKVLAVHEFGHSFVNPAVDRLPVSLIRNTAYLFEPIKKEMEKRAYPSWRICLYEHFVKAGEYLVALKSGDTARAKTFMKDAVEAGFIYLPLLAEELAHWEKEVSGGPFDEGMMRAMKALEKTYAKP
jgi:hypothetical protein